MKVSNQPKLLFHGVDFINIKFDTFQQYDSKTEIDLKIEPKVFYSDNEDTLFKIFMEVSLNCKDYFYLTVVGIGNFKFDKEFEDEKLKS